MRLEAGNLAVIVDVLYVIRTSSWSRVVAVCNTTFCPEAVDGFEDNF